MKKIKNKRLRQGQSIYIINNIGCLIHFHSLSNDEIKLLNYYSNVRMIKIFKTLNNARNYCTSNYWNSLKYYKYINVNTCYNYYNYILQFWSYNPYRFIPFFWVNNFEELEENLQSNLSKYLPDWNINSLYENKEEILAIVKEHLELMFDEKNLKYIL